MRRELAVIVAVTLVAVLVIVAMWPHEANNATLRLSHGSGFYPDTIAVEVSFEGSGPVWFTTDGTQPDPVKNPGSTRQVNGPIVVADRTDQPNVYAQIPTTVEELLPFVAPSGNVPKATVLRVGADNASEVFATYFVGPNLAQSDLAVVSLIAEPAYLFDYDTGIRVPGRLTDMWRDSDRYVPDPLPPQIEANFQMRGREWERPSVADVGNPVIVELCEPAVGCVVQQPVGIRTHGGWSRSNSPDKSWRLYAREEYGEPALAVAFLGEDRPQPTRLIFRNGGNEWAQLRFMDVFWQSLMPATHVATQAHRSVRLFVNGEYWGLYHVRERQDAHYIAQLYGVAHSEVELLDNSTEPAFQQLRATPPPPGFPRASPFAPHVFDSWGDAIGDPDVAVTVHDSIDVASFFDFIIAHTFAGVADWLDNNSRWWRTQTATEPATEPDTSHPHDGRWRFMLSDFDSATRARRPFTFVDANGRRPLDASPDSPLYRDGFPHLFTQLMTKPEHRHMFLSRYADLMNTAFHPNQTRPALERLVGELENEMLESRRRWSVGTMDDWYVRVDALDQFLTTRPGDMHNELATFFGLDGVFALAIDTDHTVSHVTVNTITIRRDTDDENITFDGNYFVGIPVTVAAYGRDGNVVNEWNGLPADAAWSDDGHVTFLTGTDLSLSIGTARAG